jgi:hypothetical protein
MGGMGGSIPVQCPTDCSADGQICDVDSLTCICPPDAPDHCPNDDVHCTNVSGSDPDHCGDCETACSATSTCNGGLCAPEPEAVYVGDPDFGIGPLALAGGTLYWVQRGELFSMAVSGGEVTQVSGLSGDLGGARAIALDGTNVFVAARDIDFTPPTLQRVPIAGGAPERVVTEDETIYDVAVQAGVLYYAVGNDVKSVPADAVDGTGTVVASAVDSETLFGVAVDGDLVFWSAYASDNVEVDSISADNRITLGATQGAYYGHGSLSTDGTSVYWVNGANLHRRVYDASTEQETIANSREPQITAFAINATTVYYASSDVGEFDPGGSVEKAVFGAEPQWIAREQGEVRSVVVGNDGVYWGSGSKIMRADL